MGNEASMLCEKCSKNPATYHMTAIENNKKTEVHLCEGCAQHAGVGFKFGPSVSDLLGNINKRAVGKGNNKKCPTCGVTIQQIQQNGRMGCADDYSVFEEEMKVILKGIHGNIVHTGKRPGGLLPDPRIILEAELVKLKKELDPVVKAEKYEEAAKMRDRIKTIETEIAKLEKK